MRREDGRAGCIRSLLWSRGRAIHLVGQGAGGGAQTGKISCAGRLTECCQPRPAIKNFLRLCARRGTRLRPAETLGQGQRGRAFKNHQGEREKIRNRAGKPALPAQRQRPEAVSGVRVAHLFTLDSVSGFCYASGIEASARTRKPPRSRGVRPARFMSGQGLGELTSKRERISLSIAC